MPAFERHSTGTIRAEWPIILAVLNQAGKENSKEPVLSMARRNIKLSE